MDNCNGLVYYIQRGDTLYSISRRYNIPLALVLRANPFVDIYNLRVGDAICVPVRQPAPVKLISYTVMPDDTIQDILERYHIDFEELVKNNKLSSMYLMPGMVIKLPAKSETNGRNMD